MKTQQQFFMNIFLLAEKRTMEFLSQMIAMLWWWSKYLKRFRIMGDMCIKSEVDSSHTR